MPCSPLHTKYDILASCMPVLSSKEWILRPVPLKELDVGLGRSLGTGRMSSASHLPVASTARLHPACRIRRRPQTHPSLERRRGPPFDPPPNPTIMVDQSHLEPYYDVGTYHRPISTSSAAAQAWFDRGFVWSLAFNHEEAERCFLRAIQSDPDCAILYWGVAYALGNNYNKSWELFPPGEVDTTVPRLHEYTGKAVQASNASPVERMLVEAMQLRLPRSAGDRDFASWNKRFTAAMRKVYEAYPADIDIACLYAEAMMVETPWRLWNLQTGQPAPNSHVLEVQSVLERTLATEAGQTHPGLLHLYIHAMEQSQTPEVAVTAGDRLLGLVPDSGHLNHMPSHLDTLIGDYRRAIHANALGVVADNKYVQREGGNVGFYTIYILHNMTTLIYAAMFDGQFKVAMQYTELLEEALPDSRIDSIGHFIEANLATRVMVLVRFGRWADLLVMPFPKDRIKYPITTAFAHYGRGIAHAAMGQVDEAIADRDRYLQAVADVPEDRLMFPNKAADVLKIGTAMLDGEIEYRRRNHAVAFDHLARAVELYDALVFGEPWSWMQPTRHTYAALKLEQGDVHEALASYAADLGFDGTLKRSFQHPNNVWALHGYHECLVRLGRNAEARIIAPQLKLALAIADVEIESSCFCRLDVVKERLSEEATSEAASACCSTSVVP